MRSSAPILLAVVMAIASTNVIADPEVQGRTIGETEKNLIVDYAAVHKSDVDGFIKRPSGEIESSGQFILGTKFHAQAGDQYDVNRTRTPKEKPYIERVDHRGNGRQR